MIAQTPLSTLIQRTKISSWNHIHGSFGDRFHTLDGMMVFRGERLESNASTPALISNAKSTLGDLIPRTSWGSSLSNLLTWKSWNGLRKPLITRNNNACELCGDKGASRDVHEVWSYHYPEGRNAFRGRNGLPVGVQRLEGLMTLCTDCHKCFHLGRAHIQNELEAVMLRLRGLNNWDKAKADQYYKLVSSRWERSNQYAWFLDLSGFKPPSGVFELKKAWKRTEGESITLTAANGYGSENYTAILNQQWKIEGEACVEPARTFEQAIAALKAPKRAQG